MGLDVGDDMSVELPSDPVAFPEKAVVLGNAQSGNHFHWLFESLARLGILNLGSFGNELQHARYLVPKLRPQQLESLLLAGVPECQLLTVEEPLARFAELYVPSEGSSGFIASAERLSSTFSPSASRSAHGAGFTFRAGKPDEES